MSSEIIFIGITDNVTDVCVGDKLVGDIVCRILSADKVGKFDQALKGEVGVGHRSGVIVHRGSGRVGSGLVVKTWPMSCSGI